MKILVKNQLSIIRNSVERPINCPKNSIIESDDFGITALELADFVKNDEVKIVKD